jgi:hypothetical protein
VGAHAVPRTVAAGNMLLVESQDDGISHDEEVPRAFAPKKELSVNFRPVRLHSLCMRLTSTSASAAAPSHASAARDAAAAAAMRPASASSCCCSTRAHIRSEQYITVQGIARVM